MNIELVHAIPELEKPYKDLVKKMINAKLITLEEWNTKYKDYRDSCGYSILHYFEAFLFEIDSFITNNPLMLDNREELEKRFKVKIMTVEEALKEEQDEN